MKHIKHILIILLLFLYSGKGISQSASIVLKADYKDSAIVYQDEPLLLTVSLTNPMAEENANWNMAADRRLNTLEALLRENKITEEEYNTEKKLLEAGKKKVETIVVGTRGKSWSSMVQWEMISKSNGRAQQVQVKSMLIPATDDIAELNETGYVTAYFGIGPEEMKKIKPGTYEIVSTVEKDKSQPIVLKIRNESMPSSVTDSEAGLIKSGRYYWHTGDADKGMMYADKLLQKNPTSIDALSLKGDLYTVKEDNQEALKYYRKALQEFYKQNPDESESPEYLIVMIGLLQEVQE